MQSCRRRRGRGTSPPPPSRSVNPTSTRGKIVPTTLQLAPRIFRPSYGPGMHCFVPTYMYNCTLLPYHRPDGTYRVRGGTLIYFCCYINPAYYPETNLILVADYNLLSLDLKMFRQACTIRPLFWFHYFGLETKNISRQDKIG